MSSSYNPGNGLEKACRLSNTIHSEVAPCLPLPSLPVFCGAADKELRLFDEQNRSSSGALSIDRKEVLAQGSKISDLLRDCDASYLNLKDGERFTPYCTSEPSRLHHEILQYNTEAFEYSTPGLIKERNRSSSGSAQKVLEKNEPTIINAQREYERTPNHHSSASVNDAQTSASSKKTKVRKKGSADVSLPTWQDPVEQQDGTIGRFCEVLEDLCSRAQTLNEDQDEADAQPLSSDDLKMLVNEIMSLRAKKILHLVPVDILVRLLNVLDRQIRGAEGLSIDDNEEFYSDDVSMVICDMESTHASLATMTNHDMPKQLYKEEILDRILDFSRHQIVETMSACDPSYRVLHKPTENGAIDGEEDDEADPNFGSTGKKRRRGRGVKARWSTGNKIHAAMNPVLQKLCTILGFLKDLLLIERLSDEVPKRR